MSEITITDANFNDEVLNSPVPVLLDFWAPWCKPCRIIAPFIQEIAAEYDGRLKAGKINVDEQNGLAVQHNISSIPTLAVYKNGNLEYLQPGAATKADMESLIKQYL